MSASVCLAGTFQASSKRIVGRYFPLTRPYTLSLSNFLRTSLCLLQTLLQQLHMQLGRIISMLCHLRRPHQFATDVALVRMFFANGCMLVQVSTLHLLAATTRTINRELWQIAGLCIHEEPAISAVKRTQLFSELVCCNRRTVLSLVCWQTVQEFICEQK